MHRWFLALCLLVAAASAVACPDDEYESCQSGCLVNNPLTGGCSQGWKTCQCNKKIGGDVGKAAEQAKGTVNNVVKDVQQLGTDTLTTFQKAGGDTVKALQTAAGQTVTTLVKAGGDTVNTFVKAGQDATVTYVKGWKDSSEQAKRSFQDAVDASTATTNYTINQVKAYESALNNADKRLREGKVLDSMWGLSIEPLQASEANFYRATQESTLVATAASSAAAVYGGPGGAAAYAAWASYRATGNVDQALRAGLLAAATAQAGGTVATMPSGTMGEVLKKAAMAGAAGGIAVAAAGGDEQAIKEGFLKSAGTVLIQVGSEKANAYSPKAKDAWDTVQCISARDVDCLSKTTWAKDAKGKILTDAQGKPRIDTTKLDPRQYIGKWTAVDPNLPESKKIAFLTKLSQLPKAEAIPLMKNKWALTWTVGKSPEIKYGEPTVVLTYVGVTPPFVSSVSYGESDPTESWISADLASGNYDCVLAGIKRTVRTTVRGSACDAIYRREGRQDVLYHSDHHPEVCAQEAIDFVEQKKVPGMQCSPL